MNAVILRKRTIIIAALLLFMLLLTMGYAGKVSSLPDKSGSAAKAMSDFLAVLKQAKSYRFKGAGTIKYIGINDTGNFTITGEYKAPSRSHMKIELKLGSANYYSETFYRNQTIYQMVNQTWKKIPDSPDTLMQPGYKPVNLLINQFNQVAANPVFQKDAEIEGQKYTVIKAVASPKKLRSYLTKQFNRSAGLEPERLPAMMNFLRSCTISQEYTFYIDPQSKQIVKLLFHQEAKINLSGRLSTTTLDMDYSLSDFGSKIDIPSIPGKK